MYFSDRYDAARQLVPLLEHYKHQNGVILAVPRGGVPIGYYLAKHLGLSLDLLMTKKIGHPVNEEYAIGAVGLEDSFIENSIRGIPYTYIQRETARIRQQLAGRYKQFMGDRKPIDIQDRIVIVADDGIATGRTILATLKMLKSKQPRKLIVAVPVASPQAAQRISKEVDEFICLHTPYPFYGVGRFYKDFTQVDDNEVMRLLHELNTRGHAA
jgi:predicted phosphoribosyltransferase